MQYTIPGPDKIRHYFLLEMAEIRYILVECSMEEWQYGTIEEKQFVRMEEWKYGIEQRVVEQKYGSG